MRLLPVFLDHIFRPTIKEDVVQQEVFHRDGTGTGRGVVYCEMQAREWSEADRLDLALRRNVMARAGLPALDVYRWECGGAAECIATLTSDEIRQYHRRFYTPKNAVVLLCGGPDLQAELGSILSCLEATKFQSSKALADQKLPPECDRFLESEKLEFPANDETLGSVGFAWLGPTWTDLYTISALHVLMRMLKETSASPLYQHFVESADPVASDIDYEIKPSAHTVISLVFSGVPTKKIPSLGDKDKILCYLDEYLLGEELQCTLKQWMADAGAVEERLQVALKSMEIKLQEQLEDDPHELLAAYCAPEIVAARWPFPGEAAEPVVFGTAIAVMPRHLKQLSKEPVSFWSELLQKYLLVKPVEVRMSPSRKMADVVKELEQNHLKDIPMADIPKYKPTVVHQISKFGIEAPGPIRCCVSHKDGATQLVSIPNCATKRLTIAFDILSSVPAELWTLLVLFQELVFQCDLDITPAICDQFPSPFIPAGYTPYQSLIESLSTKFSTFEAAVGFDNGLFSVGYLESHFILSLHGRMDASLQELKNFAFTVLAGTVFIAERVEEVLENLTSQLKDTWREPSSVLDSRLVEKLVSVYGNGDRPKRTKGSTINPIMVECCLGLSAQTRFLKQAKKAVERDPKEILDKLETLRKCILSAPTMINFGQNETPELLPSLKMWAPLYNLPKHGSLEGVAINEECKIELIPISDITSSYLNISAPLNVLPRTHGESVPSSSSTQIDRLLCTVLLCQLLSFTEGPLYQRIRGGGLAYDASISIAMWAGLLTFHLGDSTDPVLALKAFEGLLKQVVEEAHAIINESSSDPRILTAESVRTAQAIHIYQFVAERATPASIVATAFRSTLRGLPTVGSAEEVAWNQRLLQLGLLDVAKCAVDVLPLLLDYRCAVIGLAVPKGKAASIKADLIESGYSVDFNNYLELSKDL